MRLKLIEIIPNWHPIFVHFTIALISISGLFYFLSKVAPRSQFKSDLLAAARWTLWSGSLITLFTITAGFIAYFTVRHDGPSHLAMSTHRNWALVTFALIIISFIYSLWTYRKKAEATPPFLILITLTIFFLTATAWHGAELVYRYGIGVMALPSEQTSGHGHSAHSHDAHDHH